MKRLNIYIVLTVAALMLLLYGCDTNDFLDVPAKGALSEEVLADEQGVQTLLIGAYAALDGGGWSIPGLPWEKSPNNWIYGSVAGGDAHKGSDAGDQAPINQIQLGQVDPSIGFFDSKWQALYEGITRANAVLSVLEEVEGMTEAEIANARGQARFLRGHYYFVLREMFFRVPWIDENTTDFNQPNDREIWPDIEADFQFAFDNLPDVQNQRARANRWAAAAYLAKTYVYQGKWSEAKTLYDQIIPNGVTSQGVSYDLAHSYWDNWNPAMEDGLPEAVFSIQQVANDGTGDISNANHGMMLNFPFNSPFRCCGFYQPTQDLVNSYRTEGGLPIIDGYNNEMVSNDLGVGSSEQFELYDGELDPRLDWTVGRRGVPYHDWGPHPGDRWVRDQSFAGPYAPKKNVYWRSQESQFADNNQWAPGTAINIPIIRFADVLLMAAEAEIEAGSLEQARTYVNRVRSRAANPDTWVNNDLNRGFASAEVDSEAEMLALGISSGSWVVRNDTGTTFTYLGGGTGDINNWNEYEEPNYNISEYTTTWTNANNARSAVRFERKLELAMEGKRFFDLSRWEIGAEVMNALYEFEGNLFPGSSFRGGSYNNPYYPIPQRQIDLSEGQLQQIPGY